MALSTDGGKTWRANFERTTNNFFQSADDIGTDKVSIKVTSVHGEEVILHDVPLVSDSVVTAPSNF
jgi:expansin